MSNATTKSELHERRHFCETMRDGTAGNLGPMLRVSRDTTATPFKQISPNFSVIYFTLRLQWYIHLKKRRCKYHTSFSPSCSCALSFYFRPPRPSLSLSDASVFHLAAIFLSCFLFIFVYFLRVASLTYKSSSEHTWHLRQQVIVWMIMRS